MSFKLNQTYRVALAAVLLLCSIAISLGQQQNTAVSFANPQRSRVANTTGLTLPPREVLWKSEKLFQYRESNWVQGTNGPFRFSIDVPTNQAFSMPIATAENLYLTYVADDAAFFYVIQRATGKKLLLLRFDRNGLSPPAARGDVVFFGSGRGQVTAYDVRKRTIKWTYVEKDHSFALSAPMLDDELLYMYSYEKGLYAFDSETGEVRWTFKSQSFVHTPAISGDRVVIMTALGRLISLDRNTGASHWDVLVGRDMWGPAILDKQIFIIAKDGEIRAYSLLDGSLQWKSKNAAKARTELVLYKNTIYYGGREDSVIGLDAASGTEKLRFKTNRPCQDPMIAGDLLYIACDDHKIYALDPSNLYLKWQVDNKGTRPPPIVFDGVLYGLGTDGYLVAMK